MANDGGYWNGGAGASTRGIFTAGGGKEANVAAGLYTAGSGQIATRVHFNVGSASGATSITVGLFATTAGAVTGPPAFSTSVAIAGNGDNAATVSWALTPGVVYAIAIGTAVGGVPTITCDTRTNGIDRDDNGGTFASAWSHTDFPSFALELAFDVVATGRVMRPASSIGTGGMSEMSGGMQGRAYGRSRVVVPSAFQIHQISRARADRPALRA